MNSGNEIEIKMEKKSVPDIFQQIRSISNVKQWLETFRRMVSV